MVLTLINISFGIGEFFSTTFLILIILSFCAYIYRISKYEKYKKSKYAILCLSIILTLHIVVFPFLYTLMLKSNPASFEFKTAIHDSRKRVVLNEWLDDSKDISYEIKYLENIKYSNYSILNKSLKELKQLTFTNSSIIHSDFNFSIPHRNNDLMATIYIFDKKGLLKKKLYKGGNQIGLDSMKFGSVINEDINYLKNELDYYKVKKAELDKNNFWTYATLLPFSISSIFTGNMSPLTPMANIFYTFHYIIIYFIGIGVFLHFLIINLELIIRNRKS
ncbi:MULTISPECIES: hypothetical protein [Chryseobacterium]|uniref:Cbb3-type cytochrome oxidase subunit 3 n=1 Tax=Chryseobacterium camelliae TaxID=1265445 RepID=A0ABU0TIK1_9FLAO|nr:MULTISPECIES: hypothetical protein [Chryseobacterium]MDT3409489.1 cbb3-type cytochrome oxidase subunit 3 [Pseudacidovorax intermedius]MDQ1096646.1 cbb3-type cytochrome oxidase subunit 3 [Chryseobacterium camelliae]MDQ1100588.1 cbb3-type cytochrome oxidase subunit 3 [Chryseobacterium sp. SORGH_AS_1048]MDR6087928.1 cbb3-type cytochrome oxidase subunit 3 [Chryseobacterium sp. SORGH_AS_0909]MDR6132302.1 cbb3-type cytochrome oxidase subunit 3 [Chryseobacterium sp. SORGH_AS_1175]